MTEAKAPAEPLVEIGRLTRPHGVRGEVRVMLYNAASETLARVSEVTLVRGSAPPSVRRIVSARRADKAMLLRFEGIEDRNAAETLRGAEVCVPRRVLPKLAAGEYYLSDLVGARVLAPESAAGEGLPAGGGVEVGVVVEVRVHPSVDSVVVRTPDGRLLEQALAEPWVVRVDAAEKILELSSTDGLI